MSLSRLPANEHGDATGPRESRATTLREQQNGREEGLQRAAEPGEQGRRQAPWDRGPGDPEGLGLGASRKLEFSRWPGRASPWTLPKAGNEFVSFSARSGSDLHGPPSEIAGQSCLRLHVHIYRKTFPWGEERKQSMSERARGD